ncbi:hypothetical protein J3L18_07045 [Mucilaginibacter gossypii]|uniref:hypothetical protein n=1 Tax=Mucilaginibacter gossypii TaxID=551996 RepID=UPI000DCF07E5|nr:MULTISPECIES: hypothetical protein [Mucilaginibacter]QTE38816.1 hypothetical protein J3L18_07045 [Mucilaginibacter gossypii]RAV55108.1 hypothetical protein DIU36_18055 [Mucilaginibacter rubeus]
MKKLTLITILFVCISNYLFAQWTTSGTNIYTNNAGSVVIGATAPTVVNASAALFPSVTSKFNVVTGTGPATFADLVVLNHPGVNADAVQRQIGLVFKLSSESTTGESDKMGGMLLESSNVYANLPSLSLLTANTRRLTIDASGNVGIGTITPQSKLTVNGVISADNFGFISAQRAAANNYTNLFLGGAIKDNNNGTFTVMGDGESNYFAAIRMDNNGGNIGAINFYSAPSTAGTNYSINNATLTSYLRMTLVNGNLGIGISNPTNKLDVNGTAHAKSVKIDLDGWSDYVFQKDYQLPSLTDVKSYIDQNRHLPEIPSENEMIKNGLDVSEMNKLLMKKVEELTLYAIENEQKDKEKDKLLTSLQEQINELKQQLKPASGKAKK